MRALQSIAETSTTDIPAHLFKEVLDNIEKYRLLSPLQVVSTLSSCPTATLGVVRYLLDCVSYFYLYFPCLGRDYLLRTFGAEERAMEEDQRIIDQVILAHDW